MKNKKEILFWAAALVLLIGVIVLVNLPALPFSQKKEAAPGAQKNAGSAVGDLLPDFEVRQTDGQTFRLSDHRGKTVVINVWATWCGPCVKELPHFERLYKEAGDGVAVLALHADAVTEDPAAYLEKNGYSLPAAVADAALLQNLGYMNVVPQTVIVAPDGTVTYNSAGALTYDKLAGLVGDKK